MWARTNQEAIRLLLLRDRRSNVHQWIDNDACTEASLDHDLGEDIRDPDEIDAFLARGQSPDGDGVDLVKAMIALRIVPPKVTIHSHNPDGADYMAGLLRSLSGADVTVKPWEVPANHCPLCASLVPDDGKCTKCGYPLR